MNASRALRKIMTDRMGLKMAAFSKLLGYPYSSGVQYYLDENNFGEKQFPQNFGIKLLAQLKGKGTPPITGSEILDMCDSETKQYIVAAKDSASDISVTLSQETTQQLVKESINPEVLATAIQIVLDNQQIDDQLKFKGEPNYTKITTSVLQTYMLLQKQL